MSTPFVCNPFINSATNDRNPLIKVGYEKLHKNSVLFTVTYVLMGYLLCVADHNDFDSPIVRFPSGRHNTDNGAPDIEKSYFSVAMPNNTKSFVAGETCSLASSIVDGVSEILPTPIDKVESEYIGKRHDPDSRYYARVYPEDRMKLTLGPNRHGGVKYAVITVSPFEWNNDNRVLTVHWITKRTFTLSIVGSERYNSTKVDWDCVALRATPGLHELRSFLAIS